MHRSGTSGGDGADIAADRSVDFAGNRQPGSRILDQGDQRFDAIFADAAGIQFARLRRDRCDFLCVRDDAGREELVEAQRTPIGIASAGCVGGSGEVSGVRAGNRRKQDCQHDQRMCKFAIIHYLLYRIDIILINEPQNIESPGRLAKPYFESETTQFVIAKRGLTAYLI